MNRDLQKEIDRIADAIVQLVERTDGLVLLAQLDREIPGFAQNEPPWSSHVVTTSSPHLEEEIWTKMTEAGAKALGKVLDGRVAVQFVDPRLYLLQGYVYNGSVWPIALLPAKYANWKSPNWLIRASDKVYATVKGRPGHRRLMPVPATFATDQFAL
jgi:hypothetical protein